MFPRTMTKGSSKKKRKRQSVASLGNQNASDSEGAIEDHPDTNSINRTLSQLYMSGRKDTPTKANEEKEETEANREIEKALKKKARLKEKYLHSSQGTFDDLGGIGDIIEDVKKYLDPRRDENLKELGGDCSKRILISGVSGVGKSKLVEAIVNHCGLTSLKCTIGNLSSGNPSEVDSAFRSLLNFAQSIQPSILVMDKLEKIVPKRDDSRNIEREKLIDQIINTLEQFSNENSDIILIGVTSKVEDLDLEFLMAARFNKRIHIDVPNDKERADILRVLCKNIKLAEDIDFNELGFITPGYVGADLRDLVDEARSIASDRLIESTPALVPETGMDVDTTSKPTTDGVGLSSGDVNAPAIVKNVTREDFIKATKKIRPSLKRDGFAAIPEVTWDDIGACGHIREKLLASILFPVKFSSFMKATLWDESCGVLLHGPPGCGKTSIAKALANEGGIAFISVKGPEVLNMYVGESERKIRSIFEKASKAKPCVIFFDEIDALCAERSSSSERSSVTQSVLSQLLTEMDGFDNQSCRVLATTNRLDVLDSALLRPGRFDTIIYVDVPDPPAKLEILKTITRTGRPPLSSEVSLEKIAYDPRLKNFTGADLRGLVKRAHTIAAIEMYKKLEHLEENQFSIKPHHIEAALKERGASVSDEMLAFYLKSARQAELAS